MKKTITFDQKDLVHAGYFSKPEPKAVLHGVAKLMQEVGRTTDKDVLELFKKYRELTATDVSELIPTMPHRTASSSLDRLRKKGILENKREFRESHHSDGRKREHNIYWVKKIVQKRKTK